MKENPGAYPVYSSSAHNNGLMGTYGNYMFDQELITWSIDGGGAVFFRPRHKFSVTNVCGFIICKKQIDTPFLAYQMNNIHSIMGFDYVHKAHPSVIRTLYTLGIPSIDEQKEIGSFFVHIDSTIALCQRKLDLLMQTKKALMQQIFSQQLHFKADDSSEFPDWEEKKLGQLLIQYKEMASKDGSYPHVSLTKEGVIPKTERYNRDFLVRQQNKQYRVTHKNDICYNPANLKFGVICRNKFGDGIFSPIYITYRVEQDYQPEFIEALVTREDFINHALRFQEGTVYERMAVSPDDLEKLEVSIPSLPEQRKIASCLSSADALIAQARAELEQWREVKKSLLQQLFV